jgi:hypothetical protein
VAIRASTTTVVVLCREKECGTLQVFDLRMPSPS